MLRVLLVSQAALTRLPETRCRCCRVWLMQPCAASVCCQCIVIVAAPLQLAAAAACLLLLK